MPEKEDLIRDLMDLADDKARADAEAADLKKISPSMRRSTLGRWRSCYVELEAEPPRR